MNNPPDLDLVRAHALARDLDRALDRVRAVSHALALAAVLDRSGDLERVLALTDARARDLDLTRARGLARDLDLTHALARTLALTDTLDFARAPARELTDALATARLLLGELIVGLERDNADAAGVVDDQSTSRGSKPSRTVLRLTLLTTSILPTAHRARYREEFEADLREQAEDSWRAQWRYTLGTLTTVWALRGELRRAERTPVPRRWWG